MQKSLKSKITALACCVLMAGCTAAEWQVVTTDLENIAASVLADILAGKPFAVVLADTGGQDLSLLISIINFAEADNNPKVSPATKQLYIKACAPYLAEAQTRLKAQQHGG